MRFTVRNRAAGLACALLTVDSITARAVASLIAGGTTRRANLITRPWFTHPRSIILNRNNNHDVFRRIELNVQELFRPSSVRWSRARTFHYSICEVSRGTFHFLIFRGNYICPDRFAESPRRYRYNREKKGDGKRNSPASGSTSSVIVCLLILPDTFHARRDFSETEFADEILAKSRTLSRAKSRRC